MTPTPEQDECVGLFLSGDPLVIEAGAGTGKTSTLELIARSTPKSGTYLAFNRAIVNEASERFPMNVVAMTAHGLAFRTFGRRFSERLPTKRMRSIELARILDLDPVVVRRTDGTDKKLGAGLLASLTLKAIAAWCQSADEEPSAEYVPKLHGVKNDAALRDYLQPAVEAAWADLSDPEGRLPFTHDHYLKMWQLSGPTIPGDFVLFDEAQDASPVMLAAVAGQADRGAQLVYVGDSQQQIYEWRGAVNALDRLDGNRAFLTQSWRFGQAIADAANVLLDELGADLRIRGNPSMNSTLGACSPRAILTRSNMGAVDLLLRLQKLGRKPHLVGGGEEVLRFAKAVADLQETGSSTHPDLVCFDSWGEVQAYVEEDPQGSDLALLVRMIEEYGLQIVIDAIDGMVAEREADTILSTSHKAKGREWPQVRIHSDFADPEECGPEADAETRLLYVAVTRARDVLDPRMCEPLVVRLSDLYR